MGTAFYSLLVWYPLTALGLLIGLASPPAVAAFGLVRRRIWGPRLAAALAATCFLIVANDVAWAVRSAPPPSPSPGLAELGPVLEYRALMAAVGAGPVLLLLGWAWRFLTREDVRGLFVED